MMVCYREPCYELLQVLIWRKIKGQHNVKKRLPRKSEGNFSDQISWWIFRGILGAFFLGECRSKNPPKNPQQNSNQNLGALRPKSALQGSDLDTMRGNKTGHRESLEEHLPPRGSPRGPPKTSERHTDNEDEVIQKGTSRRVSEVPSEKLWGRLPFRRLSVPKRPILKNKQSRVIFAILTFRVSHNKKIGSWTNGRCLAWNFQSRVKIWGHPNVYQNKRVAKSQLFKTQKKLATLIPFCFDTPLGAAKETPKVPKQTGTKMPIFFNLSFLKPSVFVWVGWKEWWGLHHPWWE